MKKLFLLTKTLLVAAGLLVGTNAWATVTQVWSADFASEPSGMSYSVQRGNMGIDNGFLLYDCFNQNGIWTKAEFKDTKFQVSSAWKMEFDWEAQSGNKDSGSSVTFTTNNGNAFTISWDNGASTATVTDANSTSLTTTLPIVKYSNSSTTISSLPTKITIVGDPNNGVYLTVTRENTTYVNNVLVTSTFGYPSAFNASLKRYYSKMALDNIVFSTMDAPAFTLSATEATPTVGGNEIVEVSGIKGSISVSSTNTDIATATYNDGKVTINGVADGVANIRVTGTNDGLTKTQVIETTVGSVATTTVTINYKSGSTSIADPVIIEDVAVGSTLTASDITYDDVVYGSGVRYVNPTPDQTIPYVVVENGVININYTSQAAVTNVKKIVKAGDVTVSSTDVAQDGKYVGDVINFSFPAYINYNGTLYSKGANNKTYNQSFTLTANDQECVLTYTATDITNVVYHSEGENISGATATSAGGNMNGRSSNQQCGYAESDLTLINLPAGSYKATAVIYSNSSAGATLHFQYGDTPYDETVVGASNWDTQTEEFSISSASDFKWLTSGNNKDGLDLIYIQQTGDVVSLNASGYATYSTDKDVTVSGAKAYTADLDFANSTITCAEIDGKVPAGAGVLLYGEAGANVTLTYTTGATALENNDLKGTTQADGTLASKGSNDYYALSGDTFKEFTGDAFVHHKAYFEVEGGVVQARSMRIVFDGVTGINEAKAEAAEKDGKFVINGQLVIKKNGKMFNANGAQMK